MFYTNAGEVANNDIAKAVDVAVLALKLGDTETWRSFRAQEETLPSLAEIYSRNGYDPNGRVKAIRSAPSVN
jgi:hypothetical protein